VIPGGETGVNAMPIKHQYLYASIIHQVSVTAPSCRMMLIVAWKKQGKEGHYFVCYYPVVAIQTVLHTNYRKRVADGHGGECHQYVTHKELIDQGFEINFDGRHEDTRMLVVAGIDGEDCMYSIDEVLEDSGKLGYRVVCCWGDPSRDKDQAQHVGKLIIDSVNNDSGSTTENDNEILIQVEELIKEPVRSNEV
jgi:hypothetical protein